MTLTPRTAAVEAGLEGDRIARAAHEGRRIGERLYLGVLVGSAGIAAAAAAAGLQLGMPGWSTFAILAGGAAISQFMAIRAGSDTAEAASLPFVLAAALLLPPATSPWRRPAVWVRP